jgi:small-conductance mechanosensitive channel
VASLVVVVVAYSDRLGGMGVALGVAGAGIAFALQEVIASAAGWVALAFGRFYATGDRVQLGGIKGDVIDIGILRTTLMEVGQWVDGDLYNGRIVRIANSFVFKEPVFNYSADFAFLWDEIKVPIRYGSDWRHASAVLQSVLEEICGEYARNSRTAWSRARDRYALENARIEPLVTLIANDNWLELTGRYVVDYRERRVTKDAIFRRFLEEVDRSDNRIRLASATVELVNLPRLDVAVASAPAGAALRPAP